MLTDTIYDGVFLFLQNLATNYITYTKCFSTYYDSLSLILCIEIGHFPRTLKGWRRKGKIKFDVLIDDCHTIIFFGFFLYYQVAHMPLGTISCQIFYQILRA